ncbi:hypothetical protein [Peribacillus simplex]|uniref:hypothetical protein n=1 Tax=Peribacillus simplex TaxID=1478 RepID=UPI003CFC33D6
MDFQPARNVDEWNTLINSDSQDLIRSMDDWNSFKNTRGDVLAGLDEETIETFTEELIFNNGSLAGARYDILEDKLTHNQFKTLFEYFGFDIDQIFKEVDWQDYYCEGTGSCKLRSGYICTSSC